MFAEERLEKIIDILYKDGKVVVKDLSRQFGISQDAIRKDLKVLENKGFIERTYGGAILKNQIPRLTRVEERLKEDIEEKKIIAEKIFNLLKDGDTIFLDISSINILLAEMLGQSRLNITVISNCINVMYILSKGQNKNITLIVPEGIYDRDAGGFTGSSTIESIKKFRAQKVFIGSCGVDIKDRKISTFNMEDGNTKKAIMDIGKEVFLVMENKKFFYDGIFRFADIDDIDTIITEKKPNDDILQILNKQGIQII
ncbi:DeoR/GlpR family DNA-binding transcription regulator [Clostridium sp. Cult3]|uniref:DeoR/GlpR family DNA-binding transcription regulator n=1 Tax=Clostridium sp. Cult3 TaxID=2079004 RepID=UPI001F1F954E|nr:DeoR/GlpR family DNA-binding transcription regulator [Clostridium sp. Cult3]MCF6461397.1 DeoR/GlpR transcriptional regulator [Clostridium sp. Cult3]